MSVATSPEEIWGGDIANGSQPDLLGRKQEAEQLIAYIESVVGRRVIREDKRAYTLAVDAPYGVGKTFFLQRLTKHLGLNHPVAYVDAWADDLADDPLTALAATLIAALDPLLEKPAVRKNLSKFMAKAGKVAKIVGLGLVRRSAALAITSASVDAAEEVLSGLSEEVKETANEGLKDLGKGLVDDGSQTLSSITSHTLMQKRVTAFKENKAAVQEMKDSLAALVGSLGEQTYHAPIVIVIDELDRCRPTYAIKLLEEIKHLFDVPGLVFILGLHCDQLGHSVSGAYGAGFDGRAYLRRFIDREYQLAQPRLTPLLELLCANAVIDSRSLDWPSLIVSQVGEIKPSLPEVLSEYMKAYGLGARDAFELVDIIQTSVALSGGNPLHLPYFLPLAIGVLKGLPEDKLPVPKMKSVWAYVPNWSRINSDVSEFDFEMIAQRFQDTMRMSRVELEAEVEENRHDYVTRIVANHHQFGPERYPLWSLLGYTQLLRQVARFKNPHIELQ